MADNNIYPTMTTGRTAIGVKNYMAAILNNSNYTADLTLTLNSFYGVKANEAPEPNTVPKLGWFGIGINGHYNINDENKTVARPVKSDNLNLYEPIPFVCVPIDEDKVDYRLKYRMRRIFSIGAVQYVAYYLKPIELIDASVSIVRIDPNTQKEIAYELNPDNLRPTPPLPQTTGTITGTNTDIQVKQRFLLPISGSEIANPVSVLYNGDMAKARLSEYGLFTGQEKTVTGYDSNNIAFQYNEVICAQLSYHTCTDGMSGSDPSSVLNRTITMSGGNLLTLG